MRVLRHFIFSGKKRDPTVIVKCEVFHVWSEKHTWGRLLLLLLALSFNYMRGNALPHSPSLSLSRCPSLSLSFSDIMARK